ncbi:xylulokinase [soil metagenome]
MTTNAADSDAPILIGLDIGTTNIKATAFTPDGALLASSSVPTITHYPSPGCAYYLADEIWSSATGVLRSLVAQIDFPERIAGIATASMGEAGVLIDQHCDALCPIIAWFERRTLLQMDQVIELLGEERIATLTGIRPQPIYSLLKQLWLREHDPHAFNQAKRWLHMADFIAFKLCGVPATDWSLASRTMAFDIAGLRWSEEILEAVGISESLYAPAIRSGAGIGTITPAASAETGLPVGCTVSTGGHDHICGAFAGGATLHGSMLDSLGTAEALFMALDRPIADPWFSMSGYAIGAHTAPGMYYVSGSVWSSGSSIRWLREMIGADSDLGLLLQEAAATPAGSNGAMFLPHLLLGDAPHADNRSRGALVGLSGGLSRGAITRAVIEGVAFESRAGYEPLIQYTSRARFPEITAIGGGARNRLLLEIKASVMNTPLKVLEISEATSLGAAMLAGIGAGVYNDTLDAQRQVQLRSTIVEPDPRLVEHYDRLYKDAFLKLYDATKEINHTLYALSAIDGGVA